jgi:hypothetical protein
MSAMIKSEREDLQRLVRRREKVEISAAKQRSADLLADFESQMASEFRFNADVVWAEAAREAQHEIDKAQKRIAERCRELGIPEQFAPGLNLRWHHRSYDNSVKQRRDELRRVAQAQVEALERQAVVRIQQASVEAQTELALAGEAARNFIERLPTSKA